MATTHRAALLSSPGKSLEIADADTLHAGLGEILIRNYALALQPLDAKMLIAGYGPAANLAYPAVLGTSGAGIVEAVGEDVQGLAVGDRVVFDTKAYVDVSNNRRTGTWQQLTACDAKTVAKVRVCRKRLKVGTRVG
jgi:NADPH:quinone reductase-like Zn-dependent oxidoreductase